MTLFAAENVVGNIKSVVVPSLFVILIILVSVSGVSAPAVLESCLHITANEHLSPDADILTCVASIGRENCSTLDGVDVLIIIRKFLFQRQMFVLFSTLVMAIMWHLEILLKLP
jgi:hypothetical protein